MATRKVRGTRVTPKDRISTKMSLLRRKIAEGKRRVLLQNEILRRERKEKQKVSLKVIALPQSTKKLEANK